MNCNANFTEKEVEYVIENAMRGDGFVFALRSDFRESPKRVVSWLKSTNTLSYQKFVNPKK
jgi:hypothetical protein